MRDLRLGPRGNPTATVALAGSTLPELVDHCTALLRRPMSDEVLCRLLDDMHFARERELRHEQRRAS